ncbi:MAG: TonB-dependent receptor [Gemmataceae bacterium]|nr:TonB-dependent receptor [Gemmataceae bacterium]MDW8224242.1 TonB-dependent receptor [Gemmatales bacterium]
MPALKPIVRYMLLAFGGASTLLISHSVAAQQAEERAERIIITGTRITKRDFETSSPVVTISAEELRAHQDITLETLLNTLPQANPDGTTTSNNPGNNGQANINLRGLGSNRNLILIDGRRPMVSSADQTVDLNTIPLSLIESIEVITGGAAAVYGADAVAGVVNIRLKPRFEGVELNAGYADSEKKDAFERNVSALIGGNFGDRRGNAVLSFEFADREGLIKRQRDFAKVATSTTSFFPEGTYRPTSNNAPSQAAVDALFGQASYGGAPPGSVPRTLPVGFNLDGTLFSVGIFNSPVDVRNWRYPVDDSVNTRLFPDVYSYNFDAVNILVLPLERRSMMTKFDYRFANDVEVFGRFSNTRYSATQALAPTPVPTVSVAATGLASPTEASSPLVTAAINPNTGAPFNSGNQLVVPVTNPFIPADLQTLLASRTGDNPALVGAGATEPFFMRWRTLPIGLRTQDFDNIVNQYLGGAKGPLAGKTWTWEAYASEGRTKISTVQSGNVNTQRLQQALEAPDGGVSLCAGGVNPFGRQPLSQECIDFLQVKTATSEEFVQQIVQAFATGDVANLPAGPITAVLGAESRRFKYAFDPGAASGPISGFNVQEPAGGTNSFKDLFAELAFPVLRNAPMAKDLDISLAYRNSTSRFKDEINGVESPRKRANTWALNLNWVPVDTWRGRASLQRSVRAPNFGELFSGGGSAPQIFDPCSVTSNARTVGPNAAQLRLLCRDAGQIGGLGGAVDTFVQTPGTQASIVFSGNRELDPETGQSMTLGAVWQPEFRGALSGLRASVDYYRIKVKDAIVFTDTNELIADCYNFYGNNSAYSPSYPNCAGIFRLNDILFLDNLASPDQTFTSTNGGKIQTSGIDVQVNLGPIVGPGRLDVTLNVNRLLEYKLQTAPNLPYNDFTGTIPYFGAGFGLAHPKWKASLLTRYKIAQYAIDARVRYIDKMKNRMEVIFPGEKFTGVKETYYWDFGASWEFTKNGLLRVGVNNAFDQKPRTYQPNVQSGTDPSTYDVIGRRFFVQAQVRFQ